MDKCYKYSVAIFNQAVNNMRTKCCGKIWDKKPLRIFMDIQKREKIHFGIVVYLIQNLIYRKDEKTAYKYWYAV